MPVPGAFDIVMVPPKRLRIEPVISLLIPVPVVFDIVIVPELENVAPLLIA